MKRIVDIKNNKYWVSVVTAWAGTLLVLIACYFVFNVPKNGVLIQVQRQYTESSDLALIAKKAAQQDVQDEMKRRFEEANQTVLRFSVPQDNTNGLVFEIGKIANELGLSEFSSKDQTSRDVSTLGENSGVTEGWLKVEFKSSFLQLAQFVNRLESEAPTVFVEQMTLRRNDSNSREHEIDMVLSFLVTQAQNNSVAMADASVN